MANHHPQILHNTSGAFDDIYSHTIANDAPSDTITATGTIKSSAGFRFGDGTLMSSAPFTPTFFKIKLDTNKVIGFASPGQIADLFGAGTIEINTSSYSINTTSGAQGVIIPATGLYEISYNIRTFNGTTTGGNGNNDRCQYKLLFISILLILMK